MWWFGWMQLSVAGPLSWIPSSGLCPVDEVAHAEAVRDALVECRAAGTFTTATGLERVRWEVVRSCMGALGWVEIGAVERASCARGEPRVTLPAPPTDPWLAYECRLESVTLDPEGEPRVDRGAERRCIAASPTTLAEVTEW